MLRKLLIGAQFALGLWMLWLCASFLGWPFVLGVCAVAWPLHTLAESNPDRWGWLFEWPRTSQPVTAKPVDPAALDGDPVF